MSAIDETIYNLLNYLPQCSLSQTANSKDYYRSIFAENVLQNYSKNKDSHRTMGLATVSKPDPCHPLRRRQHYTELPEVTPFIRPHRMPPIPKLNSDVARKQCNTLCKNFIEDNINKIKCSLPKTPSRYIVSDRKGNKYLINGSGLQKDFIHKKDYGKIPRYLESRKLHEPEPCSSIENRCITMLSAEERLCLINNLKDRYRETFAEYQRLPLHVETISAIEQKTSLTNELVGLERNIDFLERYQQIFIVDKYSDIKKYYKLMRNKQEIYI